MLPDVPLQPPKPVSRSLLRIGIVLIGISLSATSLSAAQERPSFAGRFYNAVAAWTADNPLSKNDRAQVPAPLLSRFDNFVRCRAGFRSGLSLPSTFFEKAAATHVQTLERALTCLAVGPGIGAAATEYARNAVVLYEWEGMPDSPIEEARYAEAYVAARPRSPFVPYLYLFAAERWRYAFEYFVRDHNSEGIARSADKYRDLIDRARNADPLVRLVANDLDERPYLTSNIGRHPRDQ
jgi:hypothetical protein